MDDHAHHTIPHSPPDVPAPDPGESVPLQHAFAWDCPSCGAENFQRAISVVLTDDAAEEFLRQTGDLESWQEIEDGRTLVAERAPSVVVCRRCESSFPVCISEVVGDADDLRAMLDAEDGEGEGEDGGDAGDATDVDTE